MNDYFSSIAAGAGQFNKKKNDLQLIENEITEFNSAIEKYTKEKYGIQISIKYDKVQDSFLETIALKKHIFASYTDFLVMVAEDGSRFPFQKFSIHLGGFPIIAKSDNEEILITTIQGLKSYLTNLPKEYRFFYEIERIIYEMAKKNQIADEDKDNRD